MTAEPWICPRCDTVLAPAVLEHHCKPDDGGAAVPAVTPILPSGGGGGGSTSVSLTGGTGYVALTGETFTGLIAEGGSSGTVAGTAWEGVTITAVNAA